MADRRNIWAAEACLRRALEALLDLGHHICAKGFGLGVSEYGEIGSRLEGFGALSAQEAHLLRLLAGYPNRLVHFYHEVTPDELYELCRGHLGDIEVVVNTYRNWLRANGHLLDKTL
jgi:uncharacterized protein YutE (UPF0331/DUF86 family)